VGIIEDYLNSEDDVKASPQVKSSGGSSIIDQYLNSEDDNSKGPVRDLGNYPKPFTEAEKIEAAKPKANPRDSMLVEGIKNLPSDIGTAIKDAAVSGAELAGQGITDFRSGNKLKGIGEVGLGGLAAVTSPVSGGLKAAVEEPVTQITGNPNIGERASFVAGALVPAVPSARVISKAIPKNSAFRTLVESIGEENVPSLVREMKSNPRLTPADLSPKVMQDTQHLFTVDGPHINKLARATENRANTAKDAVLDIYDTSAGPSVDLVQKINDLAQASKNVGAKEINPALVNAGPVDISRSLQAIDDVLKPGVLKVGDSVPLTSVKKELQGIQKNLRASKEYNASDLHSFQSGLRRTAESLLRSADGSSKEVGRALMEVRNNLVNDIDKASGGKYKPALSKYRDEMHISDAFKEGYQGIFSSSKSMENTPSFTRQWFNGLTDAEKQAAREGARASIATEIGVAKNPALAGEALSRSDFNREKLRILFGEKEANQLITRLEHERKIADTNNKLVHGSQTAMRNASKEAFDLPKPSDPNRFLPPVIAEGVSLAATGTPLLGASAYYGARGASKLKDAIQGKLQREHNARYVNMALPTNEPDRQTLIRSLEAVANRPVKQSLLRRGASALAKVVQP
jgi:hypothetical protein